MDTGCCLLVDLIPSLACRMLHAREEEDPAWRRDVCDFLETKWWFNKLQQGEKKSQRQIGQVSALVQGSPDAERRMLRQCARCGLPTATLGLVQRRQSLARTVSAHVQLKLPLFFSTGLWRLHESLQILGLMCHVLELTLFVFVYLLLVAGGTLT